MNDDPKPSLRDRAVALVPVPKVLVPAVAGAVAIVAKVIATGELNRDELAAAWLLLGYAAIGWTTPEG
jgi:hypothetical protein